MMGQCHIGGFGVGSSGVDWATWTGSLDGSNTSTGGSQTGVKIVIKKLDTDKFIAFWPASGTVYKAVIVTLSGTTPSFGSITDVFTVTAGSVNSFSAVVLDSGRVMIAYSDGGANGLYGRILSISGTTITTNSIATILSSATYANLQLVLQDTDKVMSVYLDGNVGKALITTITGTTINSPGTVYTFEASSINGYIAATVLTSTTSIVAYCIATTTAKAIVLSVSGTTISGGTKATLDTAAANDIGGICALSPTSVIVSYAGTGGVGISPGQAIPLTISGTSISVLTKATFVATDINTSTTASGTIALNSTQFMTSYTVYSTSRPWVVVGTISGSTIAYGTPVLIDTASSTGNLSLSLVDDGRAILLFSPSSVPKVRVMKQI